MRLPSRNAARVTTRRRAATSLAGLALVGCCVALFGGGCAGVRPHVLRSAFATDYCAPPRLARQVRGAPHADPVERAPSPSVAQRYSHSALDTARAIGALALLDRLEALTDAHAPEADVVAARQALHAEIYLADLDVTSAAAEIACDRDRTTAAATALRDADLGEVRALTAVSVILGAATSIGTGVFTALGVDPLANGLIGVIGGSLSAVFGGWSLGVRHAIVLRHPRNLLREVWSGPPHSELFPESVWAYLNRPEFSSTHRHSIRATLVHDWHDLGRLGRGPRGAPSPARVRLFFGDGGRYDADTLDDRADMLVELAAAVDLMHQELRQLATEVWRR